jgi:oxygen-independent coproporphyrinogen-3 oxidase
MMGLRLKDGLDLARLDRLVSLNPHKIKELEGFGFLEITDGRLLATDQGRPILNTLIRELMPET